MIDGSERLFEARCAISTDSKQSLYAIFPMRATHAIKTLANRFRNRSRHTFPGEAGKLLREPMGFLVLDV